MKSTKSWILITWSMLSILPADNALADAFVSPTILNAQIRINNKDIVTRNFTITGSSNLVSISDAGNGKFVIEDDFSHARFSTLGNYSTYRLGLQLRNSDIRITMVGRNLGHRFTLQGRYLSAQMQAQGIDWWVDSSGNVANAQAPSNGDAQGNDCTIVRPIQGRSDYIWAINNNSFDVTKRCSWTRTGIYQYRPNGNPTSLHGSSRKVLLDIGALQSNLAYRKAPPDIYDGQVISNANSGFSVERWEMPQAYIMQYRTIVQLRKNPYFDGVTLPGGTHNFDVKTVSGQVRGNLTVPYVMNGQFTPYNTISLNVTSSNGFKLKDTNNNEIPYSLSTTIGVRKLNIANNGAAQNPASTITFTDLSKEFHALQGRFDADFSASTAIPTGTYTDTVTAVYTISL